MTCQHILSTRQHNAQMEVVRYRHKTTLVGCSVIHPMGVTAQRVLVIEHILQCRCACV